MAQDSESTPLIRELAAAGQLELVRGLALTHFHDRNHQFLLALRTYGAEHRDVVQARRLRDAELELVSVLGVEIGAAVAA